MDEGLFESNAADGYSVDNLPPATPEDLFASASGNDISIGWSYIHDDDFGYHQLNSLGDDPSYTTSNDITTNLGVFYNEYSVNSVDVHGNLSDPSSERVAGYDLHPGANLVSFSVLPDDPSVSNVINTLDITSIIGEGVASSYSDALGWLGSVGDIDQCQGYWLLSSGGGVLVTVGNKEECTEYDIHYGANLIGYTCSYPLSISSIENLLVENDINTIIGEGLATTYNPILGFVGSLESLAPGSGYWFIGDSDDMQFGLECPAERPEASSRIVIPPIGGYAQSTQQAFYFFGDVEGIEAGDVIRSYHGDHLIGARAWFGAYSDVPAMGLDFGTHAQGPAARQGKLAVLVQSGSVNHRLSESH